MPTKPDPILAKIIALEKELKVLKLEHSESKRKERSYEDSCGGDTTGPQQTADRPNQRFHDPIGRKLSIGDKVSFRPKNCGINTRSLGVIIKFTPRRAYVRPSDSTNNNDIVLRSPNCLTLV